MAETTVETSGNNNPEKKKKLPFGHYKSIQLSLKGGTLIENLVECKPLNQEEYSEGWQLNLPVANAFNPIHHWSVTLAQLPPHLWKKYRREYDGGKAYFPVIKDNIYYYSINESKYDADLKLLYVELMNGRDANKKVIKDILKKIDGQVNGWLTIRAKKFLKQCDEYYTSDLDFNLDL
jgi:hypothetical protein